MSSAAIFAASASFKRCDETCARPQSTRRICLRLEEDALGSHAVRIRRVQPDLIWPVNALSSKMARLRAWRPARRKCRSERSPSPLKSDSPRCRVRWRHHTKRRTLDRPTPPRSTDTIHGRPSTSAGGLPVSTWTCVTPDMAAAGVRGYDCFVPTTAGSPSFRLTKTGLHGNLPRPWIGQHRLAV